MKRTKKSGDPLFDAFFEHAKLAVSDDEALEAAKALSESHKSRARRYAQGAVIGGAATPAINVAGDVIKGALTGKGVRGVLRESLSAPELAKSVTKGILGGSMVQAVRENVQLADAKKTVKTYLAEHKS